MTPLRATALLVLLLSFPALAAPIPVGGQISPPVKDARALLIPMVSEIEAGKLDLEGKADPEPVASAAAGADGAFRLEAPEPGMYRVLIQAPGFVPLERPLTPLLEETDLPAAELEKDVRVEVRVTGADGRPVLGARVRVGDRPASAFWEPDADKWRVPARTGLTDAQGKVVLARASSEGLVVRAGAPGLPFAERRDVRTSAVSLALPSGSTREVRVLDVAGKPVAGVLVRLGEARWAAGRTGEDGVLAVPLAGKLKLQVLAVAEDGRSATLYLEPRKPEEKGPRELRLPPVETLTGRVVSTLSGRPVAGALVWAGDPGAFRRTGDDGGYRLSAVPGPDLLFKAAAAGFFQEQSFWPVRAGERRAPTLALEPAFTAAGIVVDEQGRPVAGVEIEASILPGHFTDRWESGGGARTSAAGRFRIPRLAGGIAHQLKLSCRGYAPATAELPPVEPGRPGTGGREMRIVLKKGRTAFGRVVDTAGKPVAAAEVLLETPADDMMIRMMGGPDEFNRFEAAADASGRFELADLPPGTFDLTARGSGFAPTAVPGLSIPPGAGATDLGTVTLVRGVALEGYATAPDGRPVEGAHVSVTAAGDPMAALGLGEEPPAAVTGLDGFFRVEDRRAGETVDVEVRRAGYAKGSAPGVQVPSEEPLRIVLHPSSAVEGRTVDPDGRPVPGVRVVLNPTGPTAMGRGITVYTTTSMRQGLSGDDGFFRIEDVPPGSCELMAHAAGREPAKLTHLEVRSGQDLRGVEVVLPPGAFLEGRVLAPGGRPVPGARVWLVETRSVGFMGAGLARTDGEGRYRMDGVSPGTRLFRAESEGFREKVRELEVGPGENDLDFELEGGAEVTGRVVDDDGVPVPAARVFLRDSYWNAVSRPDGSFTLSNVTDGTYRIAAEKEGYAPTEGQELTVAGAVSGIEVRLSTGGAIVGQLSGLDFTELAQAKVWMDHEYRQGRILSDSSYRIDNVEPGEHRVFASLRGERQADGRVTLEPGQQEARLDLELGEGHLLSGRVLRNGEAVRGENVALGGPGVAERWARTDHAGRFRFEGLEAGTYDLTVIDPRGQGHHKETVELSRDTEVDLELVAVTLTGRVLDSSDKQPLSGVKVELLPPRGSEGGFFLHLEAATDSRGVFRLPDVPGGSWRVQAILDGYRPGEETVEVDAGSAAEELEIVLQANEGVTLQVVLASGRAPSYVRAAVLDPAGQVVASGTYPTGEEGRLRLEIVPPGSWDLILDAEGGATVTLPVTAPSHAGRVVLQQPGVLELKVPALQTARVGARVTLTDQNGKPYRSARGASLPGFGLNAGALKLERLAPGTWKLDVLAADGRTWSGTATVVPGEAVQVTLE